MIKMMEQIIQDVTLTRICYRVWQFTQKAYFHVFLNVKIQFGIIRPRLMTRTYGLYIRFVWRSTRLVLTPLTTSLSG